MRKLDITDYEVKALNSNGEILKDTYKVRQSIGIVLFHPQLKLSARQLLDNEKVAIKVEECKEDFIILEEEEYKKIKIAIEALSGLGKNELELVRRILECPTVDVVEKA